MKTQGKRCLLIASIALLFALMAGCNSESIPDPFVSPTSPPEFVDRGFGVPLLSPLGGYPKPDSAWVRMEAEWGKLAGFGVKRVNFTPKVDTEIFFSEGEAEAGTVGAWETGNDIEADWEKFFGLIFTVNVAQAGNYRINFYYNSSPDAGKPPKTVLLRLNDRQKGITVPMQNVDERSNVVQCRQIVIGPLDAGNNELWISGPLGSGTASGNWWNLDCIDIAPGPYDPNNPLQYETTPAIENFSAAHATILGKAVNDVTIGDYSAVEDAQAAFNALTADEKKVLVPQENLLIALAQKINELIQAEVAKFKSDHADALVLKVDATDTFGTGAIVSVATDADEDFVRAALAAYDALHIKVMAGLGPEHTHLLRLINKIRELNGVTVKPELVVPPPTTAFDLWLSANTPTRAANLGLSSNTKTITVSDYIDDNYTGSTYTAALAGSLANHVTISAVSGTPLTFRVSGATVGESIVKLSTVQFPDVEVTFTFTVKTTSLTGIGRAANWSAMPGGSGNVTDGTGDDSNAVYSCQTDAGHDTGRAPVDGEVTIWSFDLRSHCDDTENAEPILILGANTNATTNSNHYRFFQMNDYILLKLPDNGDWIATSTIQPFALDEWKSVDVVFDRTTPGTLKFKMFVNDVQLVLQKDSGYTGTITFGPDGTMTDTDATRLDNLGPWLSSMTWSDSSTTSYWSFRPLQ